MATINFTDQVTVVPAEWLNDVDALVWDIFSGATTATIARTNLGVAIGTDVQAYSDNLLTISNIAVTDGNIMVGNGSTWVAESGATARASLGLTISTDVQAWDADLDAIAALTHADGNIIVSDGATWTTESGATARASLGLTIGTDVQAYDADIVSLPSGTTMLFQQTAAPTGWTKQTTHNNKALRIVSGTASSGGTDSFTTVFNASKATESHTLAISEMPAHTHPLAAPANDLATGGSAGSNSITVTYDNSAIALAATASTGGGGGHTHDMTLDLQYVDVIIASKD